MRPTTTILYSTISVKIAEAHFGAPAADPAPALWACPYCGGPMVVIERLTAAQIRMRAPPPLAVEVQ